jgi:hypothetical protein
MGLSEKSSMLSRLILVRVVAWTLLLLVALVAPGAIARAEGEASDVQPIRTAKERLGVKANDEQRVDNCKVPVDLRGPKSRPDECGDVENTRMFVSCGLADLALRSRLPCLISS